MANLPHHPVGLLDGVRMYFRPLDVFRRIEDTTAYGWALAALLMGFVLLGYLVISSGLVDRDVNTATQKRLTALDASKLHITDRALFDLRVEDIHKEGQFWSTFKRIQILGLQPAGLLAQYLLIVAVLYAAVALSGRKPEFHTLLAVCVYAGFLDLFALGLKAFMSFQYRTLEVDTSLAMLVPPGEGTWMAALNPFLIWFWVLVAMGLIITRQLRKRTAIALCTLMCLVGLLLRIGQSYMMAA